MPSGWVRIDEHGCYGSLHVYTMTTIQTLMLEPRSKFHCVTYIYNKQANTSYKD